MESAAGCIVFQGLIRGSGPSLIGSHRHV